MTLQPQLDRLERFKRRISNLPLDDSNTLAALKVEIVAELLYLFGPGDHLVGEAKSVGAPMSPTKPNDPRIILANSLLENALDDGYNKRLLSYEDTKDKHLEGLANSRSVFKSILNASISRVQRNINSEIEIISQGKIWSNRIFIVHGRDEGTKQAVARVLSKLELTPVIIHEESDQGQTIIEKLHKNS